MLRPKSDIPVGTQFSPNLWDFDLFIKAVIKNSGNKKEM